MTNGMEPKPSALYNVVTRGYVALPDDRAVRVVLSLEWAQAVTRLQQLHNEGCTLVRLLEDERGLVRIEPG